MSGTREALTGAPCCLHQLQHIPTWRFCISLLFYFIFWHQPIISRHLLKDCFFTTRDFFSGGEEGGSWGWFWFFQDHLNVQAWGFWKAGLQVAKVIFLCGGFFLFSFYPRDPVLSNACHTFVSKVSFIFINLSAKIARTWSNHENVEFFRQSLKLRSSKKKT